jgi:hypothetical protein
LDGQTASEFNGSVLEDKLIFYNAVNKIINDAEGRREMYGHDMDWISNTDQRTVRAAVTATPYVPAAGTAAAVEAVAESPIQMSPQMRHSVRSLTFDSTTSKLHGVITLGCDGVFPFQLQNGSLRKITGQRNDNKFLHPNCKINVKLHLRTPITMAVERTAVTDTAYYTSANHTAVPFEIEITGANLTYESLLTDEKETMRLSRGVHNYYFDCPIIRTSACSAGTNVDNHKIQLPAGTMVIYIYWTYEDQTVYNASVNSFISTRLRFPPNLLEVKLDLPDHKGIVFKEGLQNLGVKEGYYSQSLREYHADLSRRGLISTTFDEWFPPRRPDALGYDSILFADLTSYEIKKDTELQVKCLYNNAYLPQRWSLEVICVVQQRVTYSNKKWAYQTLTN